MSAAAVEPGAGALTRPEPAASPLRIVTATSLFDGHDAAINIMRRLIQARGAEVIHLGHNRSVEEVVRAAVQEDADAVAVSSYQGGHLEYYRYLVERLEALGAGHVRVFGGGGGTITHEEIEALQAAGVERIYHPDDGLALGLDGMIDDLIARARRARALRRPPPADAGERALAAAISAIEAGDGAPQRLPVADHTPAPVVGITGTGGAGKSSVTDELVLRFLRSFPALRIAVVAVDPTRRRTGGALLGDRIRFNTLADERVFLRSMATRRQHLATSSVLREVVALLRTSGFGLVLVETAGIGQSDSEIVDLVDVPVYVMTSDYGAASQLEKIDMLELADLVVLNKFDRRGAEDALREVRRQWRRAHGAFDVPDDAVPVFPTIASHFADPGVDWLFVNLCRRIAERCGLPVEAWTPPLEAGPRLPVPHVIVPAARQRYLAEIAEVGRAANARAERQAEVARRVQRLHETLAELADPALPALGEAYPPAALRAGGDVSLERLRNAYQQALAELDPELAEALRRWPERRAALAAERSTYTVRGRTIEVDNATTTLSGTRVPKVALPRGDEWGELARFLLRENLPGHYPYTAGVYPYRRNDEDPTRMFAGEGPPEQTNRRFHYLAGGHAAVRLSTAFDSVTLYGEDPDLRPDIFGKVGNSGVSVATLDDMKKLYSGFDLCAPSTSVSMTINGPAPAVLAMFLNTAIDQQVERHLRESGRLEAVVRELDRRIPDRPRYHGPLPADHDGSGLALLGVSGAEVVDAETYGRIRDETLRRVRGTVQADILKEDQAQNTCIFSTEFSLRLMGDVQQYFIDHQVRNFYSVSVSGYHIAEAGANPITQLAFTLANGFTLVEYYLARGMAVDDFAPNFSFFFSNGMDAEYAVLGRVARRIWARAMRERYGASPRSQMLKYHIQTSGRSLHAQEMQFNDIRTTLQALYAIFDRCNSLHTNAFDEALTTPTEASVRRAVAIQLIINRELGLNACENPWQGSFVIDELTDLVEEAVYREFERLSERGGVLGAMDTMYQRGRIQDESMEYERRKHDGSLPIVGVNTFLPPEGEEAGTGTPELVRASETDRRRQVAAVTAFRARHAAEAPAALERIETAARRGENLFPVLMEAVRCCSLGQISQACYRVGGAYRRAM